MYICGCKIYMHYLYIYVLKFASGVWFSSGAVCPPAALGAPGLTDRRKEQRNADKDGEC
jgi:hypothetical protein